MEKITHAAIIFRNVTFSGMVVPQMVLTGHRHPECWEAAFKFHMVFDRNETTQGFWTDQGRFLDRYEAKKLAQENGQLLHWTEYAELFSEDLW